MGRRFFNHFITACFATLVVPTIVLASSDGFNLSWLQDQVRQHPQVVAAQRGMDATFALAEGSQRPLYNPEFATEYERNGDDDNYTVGLSQTIDLWGKRGVRTRQADFMRVAAQMNYDLVLQDKMGQALRAIVAYQASRELAGFAEKQEAQMETLLLVVEKRHQAGDIGQADAELAFLSLTQRLNETAQARVSLRQIESRLNELLPDWSEATIDIGSEFWAVEGGELTGQELDVLPAVAAAHAEYKTIERQAQLAQLESKVDPTVGISAGEDGDEDVVAVSFSVPLNFRNNYKAEARASTLESAAAKQRYRAVKRQYHFASRSALSSLQEYRVHYNRWQTLMQGRDKASDALLAQQWDSGDLTTTEYLLALGQITEGMVAGIELRRQFQLACIDWLQIAGQLRVATATTHKLD